jgi:hypothetical protein
MCRSSPRVVVHEIGRRDLPLGLLLAIAGSATVIVASCLRQRLGQAMADDSLAETISILHGIPGGGEVVAWFGGWPKFGDAEVLELRLVRKGRSRLRLAAMFSEGGEYSGPPIKHAVFDFSLRDLIDVHLDGYGGQNVIGRFTLRRPREQALHPSLLGHGPARGEVEIELEPCAGAFGSIRCTIERIAITPVADYQEADKLAAGLDE